MNDTPILVQRNGWYWQLTLNRPDKANAISHAMLQTLRDVLERAGDDETLRALVITGAGERAFSGGADLAELSPGGDETLWTDVADALHGLPMLTLASINGACIGGALLLALACDLRVCVDQASFAYPALANGVLPGPAESARMRALLGPGRSAMLLLGGVRIDAATALQWGLVEQLVQRDRLASAVAELLQGARDAERDHLLRMKRRWRGEDR